MRSFAAKSSKVGQCFQPVSIRSAELILHDLGLSVSGAFELFCRQIILNNGLPFSVQLPNETTRKAIHASRNADGKQFETPDKLFEDLGI